MSNKRKQQKAKEPIKVRFKQLANGNKSIYLDYYMDGSREYEFLKLYLIPEKSHVERAANVETLKLANAIKAKKIVELQNMGHGFSVSSRRSKVNILDYIESIAEGKKNKAVKEGRKGSDSVYFTYMSLHAHIKKYSGNKTTFNQVDKKYCEGFIEYIRTAKNRNNDKVILSENTQVCYIKNFEYILNCAIIDSITNVNPFKHIKPENKPKRRDTDRCFLTENELKMLSQTEYPFLPIMKQAFLFSCYSGLRFSDIKELRWNNLQKENDGNISIYHTQKKTKKHEKLPLVKIAIPYLPTRPDMAKDDDFVFNMPSGCYVNIHLKQWACLAGIKKHLTFHVARHTYATLLLSYDVPIETISGLLGHSDIHITQVYAKIMDKNKRDAVDKLNNLKD
jgi:integrase